MTKEAHVKFKDKSLNSKPDRKALDALRSELNTSMDADKVNAAITMIGLLVEFGIDKHNKDCWLELSYALANKYVPAMRIAKRSGATAKWRGIDEMALYILIESEKEKNPKTVYTDIYSKIANLAHGSALYELVEGIKAESIGTRRRKYISGNGLKAFKMFADAMGLDYTKDFALFKKLPVFEDYFSKN